MVKTKLKKCPRCELNYILDGGSLCTVCREEVHGRKVDEEDDDGQLICSACGDAPALPGEDMCRACLADFRKLQLVRPDDADTDEDVEVDTAELERESLTDMEELEGLDDLEDDVEDVDAGEDDPLYEDFAKAQ